MPVLKSVGSNLVLSVNIPLNIDLKIEKKKKQQKRKDDDREGGWTSTATRDIDEKDGF